MAPYSGFMGPWPLKQTQGSVFSTAEATHLPQAPPAACPAVRALCGQFESGGLGPECLAWPPARLAMGRKGHLLGFGLPVALQGAPHPQECGAWQPPGWSGCVCLEPLLCQPQRCSKMLGLRRLGRCQKDKSKSFPSLSQAGFHFQDPRAADRLLGFTSTPEVRQGEAGSGHWELHRLLLPDFVYTGRGDLLHLIWSLQ